MDNARIDAEKLAECPFDGSAEISVNQYGLPDGRKQFWIKCLGCGAATATRDTLEAVIILWNRRAA